MRTAAIAIAAVVACAAPALVHAQPAASQAANQGSAPVAGADAGHWSWIERPDRVTGGIDHYLVADGTSSSPNAGDRGPTLLISCDRAQPRRVFLDFGVALYDGELTEQADGAPASSRTWARLGHTMVVMDDAGVSPNPEGTGLWKLSAAGKQATMDSTIAPSTVDSHAGEAVSTDADHTMTGADALVAQLEHVHQLVMTVQPNLPDPLSVDFNLNGLSQELADYGCPVSHSPVAEGDTQAQSIP